MCDKLSLLARLWSEFFRRSTGGWSFLIDSVILMHYDNAQEAAISWWEETVSGGGRMFISEVSLLERYRGIARLPGPRKERLTEFDERIAIMRKEGKIHGIFCITASMVQKAHELLRIHCLQYTPPQDRRRMEALICDMLIAATALLKGLPVVTFNVRDFEWINGLQVIKPDYELEEMP